MAIQGQVQAESLLQPILNVSKFDEVIKADEVEIALRSHLMDLLHVCVDADTLQPVCAFIESAVLSCLQLDRMYLAKIPFLLIEDAFDGLDSVLSRLLWANVVHSSYKSKLSDVSYFSKGKMILLRFCNKFLQKLTSKCNKDDIEFAGDVLLFLTELFPLSERSALNVTGKYNVENIATFETEEEFQQLQDNEEKARVKGIHGNVGVVGEDDTELYEDLDLPLQHPDRLPIDYHFYKTFWGLQGYLRQPNKILDDSNFADFSRSLNSVLDAFEGYQLDKVVTKNGDGFKSSQLYLTSSRLLRLQMHDPEVRMHILTQILIVLSYLALKTTSTKALEAFSSAKLRSETLLRITPTDGKDVLGLLQHILDSRESLWSKWKDEGCKPFEKVDRINEFKQTMTKASNFLDDDEMSDVEELPVLPKELLAGVPKLESFLEDYVEALDPESGIEEEYHPKNNKRFCWQSLRLIRHYDLTHKFPHVSSDGDMEKLIRNIWCDKGIKIPDGINTGIGNQLSTDIEKSLIDEINGNMENKDDISNELFGEETSDDNPDDLCENDVLNNPEGANADDELTVSNSLAVEDSGPDKDISDIEDIPNEETVNKKDNDTEKIDETLDNEGDKNMSLSEDKANVPDKQQNLKSTEESGQETSTKVSNSIESKLWRVLVKNLPRSMNAADFFNEIDRRGCRPLFVDVSYYESERMKGMSAIFHEEEARKAVKKLDRLRISGAPIQVRLDGEFERPEVPAKDTFKSKLMIGNLPNDLIEKTFRDKIHIVVGKFKNIEFSMVRNSSRNKGYAFVTFSTPLEVSLFTFDLIV